jgi:hypothetical protein
VQVAVSRNSISAKIFGRVRLLPTLAAIVRGTPLEKLDGHVLQNATR